VIISVVQRKKIMKHSSLMAAINAVNKQLERDFVPHWGMPCTLKHLDAPTDSLDTAVIYIEKEVDVDDVLGYHDRTAAGVPFGVVFTDVSAMLGEPWSVTFSHEVLEIIADPQVNLLAMGPHPKNSRKVFHWFEMCDAVQDQTYKIGRISVSNFVLPLYFTEGEEKGAHTNFLRRPLRSFGVTPGGYVGFFDPKENDHVTYAPDKRAKQRLAIKRQLSESRRSNRYKSHRVSPRK